MRRSPAQPDASVFDQLAQRIRQTARDEHANRGSGVERFTVAQLNPLVLNELAGELVLEEGDPDFTIDAQIKTARDAGDVHQGDLIWVARHEQEWHAFGRASS